jgi:hypothetical protein
MNFVGRFIDLLGQQMYGGTVPSVAELIANAWDADAEKVEVALPEDITKAEAEIIVKDFGAGMSFEEINEHYLNIGYERRKVTGERTAKGRLVMGRKGIGKLAGFGIAEDIIIRSVKDGHVIQFNLNYTDLTSRKSLAGFEFKPAIDESSSEQNGVTIYYKNLKTKQNINLDNFRKSMAKRFALESGKMEILINGVPLSPENLDFEYRTPQNGWQEEEIPGFGKIKYWFGFLKSTIHDPEQRGVSVFARDRVAQFTPFFFNLSGGINGQVGLEYLTGQVKADQLDSEIDYIATDRQTVNWQFGKAHILEQWGLNKIKELCRDWKKRRDENKENKFKHEYSELYPLIRALPEQERKDLEDALEKIAKMDRVNTDEFMIFARALVSGVQRESVRKVIRKINNSADEGLDELYQVIKEWDVISAVALAEVVQGKIEIIQQFKDHINERLPEKKKGGHDMQTFIKDHPWLLGQEYEYLKAADFHHEHGVDKWIEDEIQATNKEFPENSHERESRRFDLLCLVHDQKIVILELMRPGESADYDHASRLVRYVTRIDAAVKDFSTKNKYQRVSVYGLLICDNMAKDKALQDFLQTVRHNIDAIEWKTLFIDVQSKYKDFLDILKMKAPEDPRIKGLVEFNN